MQLGHRNSCEVFSKGYVAEIEQFLLVCLFFNMFTNLKGCKHDMNMILTEICCQTNFLIFAMFFVFKARFLKVHVCSKIKYISMFSTKD